MNGIAKIGIEDIHIAAVPRHFDGVTDGALHTGGRGIILFGDGRIQHLGHAVDDIRFADGHDDAIPDILVALDMRRDPDLQNDLGHHRFQIDGLILLPVFLVQVIRNGMLPAQRHDALRDDIRVEGLDKMIGGAFLDKLAGDTGSIHIGHGNHDGTYLTISPIDSDEYPQGIQIAHKGFHQNNLGLVLPDQIQQKLSVFSAQNSLKALCIQSSFTSVAKFAAVIGNQQIFSVIHVYSSSNYGISGRCYDITINCKWFQQIIQIFLKKIFASFFYN